MTRRTLRRNGYRYFDGDTFVLIAPRSAWPVGLGGRVSALVAITAAVVVASIGVTSAFFSATSTATFSVSTDHAFTVEAVVDLKPESLQKRSSGMPVTGFIELPAGFDVRDVVVASIRLCRGEDPCSDGVEATRPKTGDADGDGTPDLKVQFARSEVVALVADVTPPRGISFAVSGRVDARTFLGTDVVRIIDPAPGPEPAPGQSPVPTSPADPPQISPSPSGSPTPDPSPTEADEPSPTPSETVEPSASEAVEPSATDEPDPSPNGGG